MIKPQETPFGSWRSPIEADLITSSTVGLGQVALNGEDIYWSELRLWERGRTVVVRQSANHPPCDVTPAGFNVRTRVHEYGGGSFFVCDRTVYFSNFADGRFYRQDLGKEPQPITPETAMRFGDGVFNRQHQRIICVCEDHTVAGREPINTIVSVGLEEEGNPQLLVYGNDFYASPRLSPDNSRLAWLTWNHPNMPWDGTELWVGFLKADGSVGHTEKVAGGLDESIFQPQWSPDGTLYFISDKTGWWNLYRWRDGTVEALTEMTAEFGITSMAFGDVHLCLRVS